MPDQANTVQAKILMLSASNVYGQCHVLSTDVALHQGEKMIKAPEDQWLSIQEVTERLQKSTKTVERLVNRGHLQTRMFAMPGRRAARFYSAVDIERLIDHPVASTAVNPKSSKIAPIGRTKEFAFPVPEGPVLISLPAQLADTSLADTVEFVGLLLRQLQRERGATPTASPESCD